MLTLKNTQIPPKLLNQLRLQWEAEIRRLQMLLEITETPEESPPSEAS